MNGVKYGDGGVESLGEWKLFASSRRGAHRADDHARRPVLHGDRDRRRVGRVRVGVGARSPPRQAGWEYVRRVPAEGRRADRRGRGREAQGPRGRDRQARSDPRAVAPVARRSTSRSATRPSSIARSATRRTSPARRSRPPRSSASSASAADSHHLRRQDARPARSRRADGTTTACDAARGTIIEKGLFVGYQTTREQAAWIGETGVARHVVRQDSRQRAVPAHAQRVARAGREGSSARRSRRGDRRRHLIVRRRLVVDRSPALQLPVLGADRRTK